MTTEEAITYMESRHRALKSAHAGTDPIFINAYQALAEYYRLATLALIEKQERESKVEQSQDYRFEVGV